MPGPKVLVVDDERDIRSTLDDLLGSQGFSVFVAANGRDALDLLRFGLRPALIILDLMMPVFNGFDFLKARSADAVMAQIPVLVLSVSRSYDAESLGVQAVLHKPITVEELLGTIERITAAPQAADEAP